MKPICSEKCYAMPDCAVCRRRKAPMGRSVAAEMANSLCNPDCPGYYVYPRSGHLWPGEPPDPA